MLTKLRDTFPPTRNEDGVLKPTSFTASNLAVRINDRELVSVRDFLFEGTFIGEEGGKVSALSVGKRLAMSVDNPTLVEDYVLTLKSGTGGKSYKELLGAEDACRRLRLRGRGEMARLLRRSPPLHRPVFPLVAKIFFSESPASLCGTLSQPIRESRRVGAPGGPPNRKRFSDPTALTA